MRGQTIRLPSPSRRAIAGPMSRITLLFRVAFWSAVLFALVMALLPQPPQLSSSDKVQHMLAFATITAMALFAYPRIPPLRIGIALSAFGAAIEFLQLIPAIHRDGDVADWVADTVAIFVVIALIAVLRRRPRLT